MEKNSKLSLFYFGFIFVSGFLILFMLYRMIGMLHKNADFNVHSLQDKMVNSYAVNVNLYDKLVKKYEKNLQEALDKTDTVPGVIIKETIIKEKNIKDLKSKLKIEGLDENRLIVDSDGTYIYLIKWGDNLTKLSRCFGYSVDELANFNQIRDVNLIYAESALRIPNSKKSK